MQALLQAVLRASFGLNGRPEARTGNGCDGLIGGRRVELRPVAGSRHQRPVGSTFVAWVGGASAGFYLFGRLPGMSAPVALAQIPGGTLDPSDVTKFVTPC